MAITTSDIGFYRAANNFDGSGNGGLENLSSPIVSGQLCNIFPDITQAERTAGLTRYRKVFVHNSNADGLILYVTRIWLDTLSTAADYIRLYHGIDPDPMQSTQGQVSAKPFIGTGLLHAAISAGANTLVVDFEASDLNGVMLAGQRLLITDKDAPGGVAGNSEFVTVSGTPEWNGSSCTITLLTPTQYAYSTTRGTVPCRVAMVADVGDVRAYVDTVGTTHLGGATFTGTIQARFQGAERDTIRVEFDNATQFTCTGTRLGVLGTGSVSANFSPVNPKTGTPYFTIPSSGWGGLPADGDYMTFELYPASVGLWLKEVVPAGTASKTDNTFTIGMSGESA